MKRQLFGVLFLCFALMTGVTMAQDLSNDTVTMASEAGTMMVPVPEGWVTSVFNTSIVYMANSAAALDNTIEDTFLPGEAQITLATVRSDYLMDASGMDDAETVMAILEYMLELPGTTGAMPQTLALTTVNDVPVATSYLKANESHSFAQVRMVSDETFLLMEIIAAPGELAQWQALGEAVFVRIDVPGDALAPDPDATPTGSFVELSETYSAEDIAFTVDIPAGWATRSSFPNGVAIGTSEAALDLWQNHAFAPGDAHAFIGYGTAEEMFEIESDEPLTPVELFEQGMAAEADASDVPFEVDGPYEATVGDWDAAYLTVTQPESAIFLVTVDTGDGNYLSSYIQTSVEEVEMMSEVLWEMLDTVRFNDASMQSDLALTEVYTADEEGFTVRYPAGWVTRAGGPNGVDIASSEAALDKIIFDSFTLGEFHAFVGYGPASDQFRGMTITGMPPEEILALGFDVEIPLGMTLGDIETFSVNDRPAAALTISHVDASAFLLVVEYADDFYLTADIYTALEDADTARELLLEMVETLDIAEAAPVKQAS
jgi:hypothetical protein